ncbi:11228_t:CDS:2 [Scutellospora calospora]|uniref:11228_t:CDS:1 n=1 Tax=Scutellospora calospora TaxID=85575 RepID=A0ACA9MKJ5_9GLOM|nr:11228_t:CDS:2 [Scutellospora calospora]
MQNRHGDFIGSMWGRKNKSFVRINSGIAVSFYSIKTSFNQYSNQIISLGMDESRQFNSNTHLMVLIQWTQKVNEDEYRLKFFREFGTKQFIDVRVIDRYVGFLKYGNLLFIIDKEVNNLDDSNIESSSEDNR